MNIKNLGILQEKKKVQTAQATFRKKPIINPNLLIKDFSQPNM